MKAKPGVGEHSAKPKQGARINVYIMGEVVSWIQGRLADPDYCSQSKDVLEEWLELMRVRGLPGVLEKLADRSEEAYRMRHSSPFAVMMPPEERLRILRRYETLRPRAHPAGV